jgi:division protein CdvB (Snf7/Vps24/ESCRT-III family)
MFSDGSRGRRETIGDKLKSLFGGPDEPIDRKIILAHYKVKTSLGRLNSYLDKLEQRDRELFQSIVESLMKKDEKRAKMYAREVAEIRRISKQLITAKYALEQVALKLETYLIFGGATKELVPVVGIMREAVDLMKGAGTDVWIDLYTAIRELETSLSTDVAGWELEMDVGLDSEARKVLEEAKIAAEQAIKEKYAELPKIIAAEEEAKSEEAA